MGFFDWGLESVNVCFWIGIKVCFVYLRFKLRNVNNMDKYLFILKEVGVEVVVVVR